MAEWFKCTTGGIAMNERTEMMSEMTNEEYQEKIIEVIRGIDNIKFLDFVYSFIISAIKKWL